MAVQPAAPQLWPLGHSASSAVKLHVGLAPSTQVSRVQEIASSQVNGVPAEQVPPMQRSAPLQLSPSEQSAAVVHPGGGPASNPASNPASVPIMIPASVPIVVPASVPMSPASTPITSPASKPITSPASKPITSPESIELASTGGGGEPASTRVPPLRAGGEEERREEEGSTKGHGGLVGNRRYPGRRAFSPPAPE